MKVTKAIIPAAGLGTRFLPFTKVVPKELLPLLNKPAIHYIAQEIADSGLSNCIMVISPHKQAILNYFEPNPELESFLKQKNKIAALEEVQSLSQALNFTSVIQKHALGLGHAVSLARSAIGDEHFAILLPDDIIKNPIPGIAQLKAIALQKKASVIAVQEVLPESISAYGVIGIKKQLSNDCFEISSVVEKPHRQDAPSNLAIIGRYIFSPHLFNALESIAPAANGELQLTDGIATLLDQGYPILAYKIQGTRYDLGTPAGWLQANNDILK